MWRSRVLWLALSLFALYGIVCLSIYVFQEKLVFFPGAPPTSTPAVRGLAFRDITLSTRDGVALHTWFLSTDGEPKGAVLLCHGNAGNIESRLVYAEFFLRRGFAVLLFDYRGYGRSTERPTEEGVYIDAETAYGHLVSVEGFEPGKIIVLGESLGGAIATELVRRVPVAGLIVENTFTSISDMGARIYPWIPIRPLVRVRFDSRSKIASIGRPLLVIHTPQDEVVPFEFGRALFETAREPKQFLSTEGAHNGGGFLLREAWMDAVLRFAESAIGG